MTDATSGARVYHVCYGSSFGKLHRIAFRFVYRLGIANKTAA